MRPILLLFRSVIVTVPGEPILTLPCHKEKWWFSKEPRDIYFKNYLVHVALWHIERVFTNGLYQMVRLLFTKKQAFHYWVRRYVKTTLMWKHTRLH